MSSVVPAPSAIITTGFLTDSNNGGKSIKTSYFATPFTTVFLADGKSSIGYEWASAAVPAPIQSALPSTDLTSTISTGSGSTTPLSTLLTTTDSTLTSVDVASPSVTPTTSPSINNVNTRATVSGTETTKQTPGKTGAVSVSPVGKSGISGGAAAGIGIGCLLIGALIALFIAFLFMKRSRKHRSSGGHRHASSFDSEKNVSPVVAPSTLEDALIDRADDSQLRKSMQDLAELIDQHVENNYNLQEFGGSQGSLERRLVECGYATDPSVSEIAALLINPRTRFVAIRELIAKIILPSDWQRGKPELSLLPSQIVGFVKAIPPTEKLAGAEDVFDKAYNRWRHLSAFLLGPSRSSREAPKAQARDLQAAIGRNVTLINGVLKPLINPSVEGQRSQENNLSAIILEVAQFHLLLFSQPSVWQIGWKISDDYGAKNTFMVFPSLAEQIERHGRQRLREVSAPVVVEL